MRQMKPILLITVIILAVVAGGFFIYRGQIAPPHSTPSQLPASSLKLYSLSPDNKTLAPPKTIFKAEEPVTFVLTFEKKSTGFWPFVKKAYAQENNQAITTQLFYNNTEAKDITVEMKPLEENRFSFSLLRKDPSQLHPGKYQFKVTREAEGQTQTIIQDFTWGVLAINTNKSIFSPGEKVYLQMASLDDGGRTLCNSDLKLVVTDPAGKVQTPDIKHSQSCGNNNVTDNPDYFSYYQLSPDQTAFGTYHLKLTNNSNKYSIDDSFEVKESVPFSVERISATRINPFKAEYTMNIKITAREDFEGPVQEQIPSSFVVLNPPKADEGSSMVGEDSSLVVQNDKDGHKNIRWNVNLKSGQTTTLSYTYQAPKLSPEFYLVGPLRFLDSQGLSLSTQGQTLYKESRQWQIASDAVTTLFMESGTDATHDGKFYTTFPSTASSDTLLANTGPRSVKCNSGAGNSACQVRFDNNLADAGRRVTLYFNLTNLPTTGTRIIDFKNSAAATVFSLNVATTGQLRLSTLGTTCKNGSIISTGTWYRVAVSYVITTTTNFSAKAFLNGTQDMSMTQADCTLNASGTDDLFIGWASTPGANLVINFDDVYLDNGTTLDDPGNIRVAAKLPASDNTGGFDTAVGASPGAGSRYTNVNERALSTTNGWRQNATSQVSENYGIQAISAGDKDLSDHSQVAYACWIYGAGSAMDTGNAQITCNGTGTAINLTTTSTMYVSYVDSTTYPTNAATVGMLSTGTATDTILYEAGIVFAYIPTGVSKVQFKGIKMQGIQVK